MQQPVIEIKQKRKLRWWWFLFIPAILVAVLVLQAIAPNPPIQIAPDTTYITEPVDDRGLPDYARYVLERSADGVDPENNAAVPLWQVGGFESVSSVQRQALIEEMQVPRVDSEFVLVEPYEYAVQPDWLPDDVAAIDEQTLVRFATDVLEQACERPWQPRDLPFADTWAEDYQKALELVRDAAKRTEYYSPAPNLITGEDRGLYAMLLPDVQEFRSFARSLQFHAMWHVSNGRYEEAWQDILTTYRLSRLCGSKNGGLIHVLVSVAVEDMAHRSLRGLLSQGLEPSLLTQIRDDYLALPDRIPMWQVYDQMERLASLSMLLELSQGDTEALEYLGAGQELSAAIRHLRLDWNIALRAMNQWFDRLTEAGKLPYAQRREALGQIDEELSQLDPRNQATRVGLGLVSTRARSELVSDLMLMYLLPAVGGAVRAEDRALMERRLTLTTLALEHYHRDHSEYPSSLDELVPNYLPEIPLDFYRDGEPLIYRRKTIGFLLYSVSENGTDSGGSNWQGDIVQGEYVAEEVQVNRNEIDQVVRLPTPMLKLPEWPEEENGGPVEQPAAELESHDVSSGEVSSGEVSSGEGTTGEGTTGEGATGGDDM